MVIFLITSVLVLGLLAIAIYFWQKPAKTEETLELPLPPQPNGLFSDYRPNQLAAAVEDEKQSRGAVLERAAKGDKDALQQAYAAKDPKLYEEVLNVFVNQVDSSATLLSLVSHVTRNEFPVSKALAQKSIDYWKESLDRHSAAKMLHVAALSDDAETYRTAIEVTLKSWRDGQLRDLSAVELQSLFNGEFWVLSSNTRSSGAGFVLKRTLSTANRELELTNSPI
jgi:hypothetical protein